MDEKIWLYLIIGVLYFLFNRLKKKNPSDEPASESPFNDPAEDNRPKPISFEDLLREITEGKQSKPAPPEIERPVYTKPVFTREEEPQPVYEDYDDELEVEERSLERVTFDKERTNEIYENAKKQAFARPSLEESLSLADVNTTFGKFKEFDVKKEQNILTEYIKDLRDPKSFKKAIILNEVLNRRHF